MAFTDHEKARIKHFLSYPNWEALAQSIQLGIPAGSQPLFLLESAYVRISPHSEDTVRHDLCECEDIEKQLRSARGRLKALQLGNLKLNPNETRQLRGELMFWTTRLADDLGVVPDPYSQMMYAQIGMAGGVNASVSG